MNISHVFTIGNKLFMIELSTLLTSNFKNYNIYNNDDIKFYLEDLSENTIEELDVFYNKFKVEKKQDEYSLIKERVIPSNINTINTHYVISDEIKQLIDSNINWDVESKFGYYKKD